jgi:hypothetical protein
MSASQYELLKCAQCEKTLGRIYIDVEMFPPKTLIHLAVGGPLIKVKKTALCEECFNRLQTDKQ